MAAASKSAAFSELRRLRTRSTAGSASVVNLRVGGSHGDLAQALAVMEHDRTGLGRGGPGAASVGFCRPITSRHFRRWRAAQLRIRQCERLGATLIAEPNPKVSQSLFARQRGGESPARGSPDPEQVDWEGLSEESKKTVEEIALRYELGFSQRPYSSPSRSCPYTAFGTMGDVLPLNAGARATRSFLARQGITRLAILDSDKDRERQVGYLNARLIARVSVRSVQSRTRGDFGPRQDILVYAIGAKR